MPKRASKSKSSSRSRKSAASRPSLRERLAEVDWARTGRIAHVVVWVLGIAGVGAAAIIGVPRLEARSAAQRPVDPATVEIRFLNPPAWVNGDLEAFLDATVRQHLTPDPFDRDALVVARQALLETGWFDEIQQVRRRGSGLLEVHATFAVPFAIVRDREGDHLVDPRGHLLPRSYPVGGKPSFVAITGARYARPLRPGLAWEGADVTAGLRLLRLLHEKPWLGQVAEVNVSRFLSEQTLVMVSDRGCRIIWGREPGAESVSEVPASKKLEYLDYHYREYGHIDRGLAHEIDITGDVVLGQ